MFELITPDALTRLRLSPCEAEVLVWVAQGKTHAEIAAALGISAPTVKKYMERILRKLGVRNRLAAAVATSERCAAAGSPNTGRGLKKPSSLGLELPKS
jgi:DNA-binding CsgD family transcriptional regulator